MNFYPIDLISLLKYLAIRVDLFLALNKNSRMKSEEPDPP